MTSVENGRDDVDCGDTNGDEVSTENQTRVGYVRFEDGMFSVIKQTQNNDQLYVFLWAELEEKIFEAAATGEELRRLGSRYYGATEIASSLIFLACSILNTYDEQCISQCSRSQILRKLRVILDDIFDSYEKRQRQRSSKVVRSIVIKHMPTVVDIIMRLGSKNQLNVTSALHSLLHMALWLGNERDDTETHSGSDCNGEKIPECRALGPLTTNYTDRLMYNIAKLETESAAAAAAAETASNLDSFEQTKALGIARTRAKLFANLVLALALPYNEKNQYWNSSGRYPYWKRGKIGSDFKSAVISTNVEYMKSHAYRTMKQGKRGGDKVVNLLGSYSDEHAFNNVRFRWSSDCAMMDFPPFFLRFSNNAIIDMPTKFIFTNFPSFTFTCLFKTNYHYERYCAIRSKSDVFASLYKAIDDCVSNATNANAENRGSLRFETGIERELSIVWTKIESSLSDHVKEQLPAIFKSEDDMRNLLHGKLELYQMFGTKQRYEYMLANLRATIFRNQRKRVLFLHSSDSNHGKTTFLRVLNAMLDEQYTEIHFAGISESSTCKDLNPSLALTRGRMIVAVDEIPSSSSSSTDSRFELSSSILRKLTSNSRGNGIRLLHENPTDEVFNSTVLIASNELPNVSMADSADINRYCYVEFPFDYSVLRNSGKKFKNDIDSVVARMSMALEYDTLVSQFAYPDWIDSVDVTKASSSPDHTKCISNFDQRYKAVAAFVAECEYRENPATEEHVRDCCEELKLFVKKKFPHVEKYINGVVNIYRQIHCKRQKTMDSFLK